ncbi:hypothetical protein ERJ75_000765600 [Trypanosoma vivax]|uniref:Mucin-associated surface protein (MASP) n=1 Tax=Trypanosoma vivax (strain Y486) TaxID=1055687 RepID=F9WUH2_TRYVY|nr:hypothetical protein TRVL_10053 [Trypanosoma vivax]KAH8613754.1 hypothetical protein ERJ75_000765600 [Trypanosoma vivax]CCD21221.1 hypothetical protein, conserved in T.vivax [Trypanosoma vivax Y486]|eukprot:CCD21221.1 hypothetical protein, conserved in T.vivax [Trypanosoma vivax Y486]
MALFLRCVFILALLGTAALGDEHAKEGPSRAHGPSKNAVSIQPRSVVLGGESGGGAGQDHFGKEEKPRLQPRGALEKQPESSCNHTNIETCKTSSENCVNADSDVCPVAPSGSSSPGTPAGSDSEELDEEEDEEDEEEEEEEEDGSTSQPQEQKAAGEVPAASEGLENKPAAPESGSSSGAKDVAEEKKENTLSPDQARDSVANEVPAKDSAGEKEKNENPDEARAGGDGQDGSSNSNEGQHSGQGTAETSGALFREQTSVALLLAILSRFCACKC